MRVILTGGGTGGHIFPAMALAREFRDKGEDKDAILFVGSSSGLDRRIIARYDLPFRTMDLEGFKGKGILKKTLSILKTMKGLFTAISIIRGFRPDLVVGTGGYSSVPIVIMASIMRIKTVLLEQNAIPGQANRLLTPFVSMIFTAFKESTAFFPGKKAMFVGNPIRREIVAYRMANNEDKGDRFNILVLGGSQGSHQINTAMIEALDYLSDIKDEIEIIHQSGKRDLPALKNAYRGKGFSFKVVEFIDAMGSAYKKSHLIICRGGATTLSEIMVCGKASVIIPFPYAADNHQEMNARVLEEKGAALVIRSGNLSGKHLAEIIKRLYKNPGTLRGMESKTLAMGKPDASRMIVENCYRLAGDSILNIEYRILKNNRQLSIENSQL